MFTRAARHSGTWWTLALLLLWLPWLAALGTSMWKTPFPVSETIGMLEDVERSPYTYLDPRTRAWYRPLYFLTWEWLWKGTGTLTRMLDAFKAIEVLAPIALVLLFIAHVRPRSMLELGAATCAVAVLVGSPGFRLNLEIPMMMTLFALPLTMIIWMLLTREPRPWHAAVIVLLTVLCIGYKEQGLVVAPVVVIAWWTRAPGAGARVTAAVVAVALAYLAVRFAFWDNWPIFEQSMGLWFGVVEPSDAVVRWGAFPYPMYVYNAVATVMNVLFSEPTNGAFEILRSIVRQQVGIGHLVVVTASVSTTAAIAWWTWRVAPGLGRDGWTRESRVALVFLFALLGTGVLSLKYSREREGGMAVLFYALAAYEALRYLAAHLVAHVNHVRRVALAMALLAAMTASWHVRAVGTLEWTRRMSEGNVRQWQDEFTKRQERFKDRPVYLSLMQRMAGQGVAPEAVRHTAYPSRVQQALGYGPE